MNELPEVNSRPSDRSTLIRDIGVLQVKLLVDGFRDLVLVPASLIAGIASLVTGTGDKPGPQFYHLLGFGKQTEQWINLFGAAENSPENLKQPNPFGNADIDDLVGRVESFVVDEYRRGKVSARAKERLEKALTAIQRRDRKDL